MNQDKDTRSLLKAASLLLQYPDKETLDLLPGCAAAVRGLPASAAASEICTLIRHLLAAQPLALQEHYTACFDLNPATSLSLTYHRFGDDKQRGAALAELNRGYREAGYGLAMPELPDHLPLVLEFLSIGPAAACERIAAEYRPAVAAVARRLAEAGSFYSGVMAIVADLMDNRRRDP